MTGSSDSSTAPVLLNSNKVYTNPIQEMLYFAKKTHSQCEKTTVIQKTLLCVFVYVYVCVYFLRVFMAVTRSPAGRVLGPTERATTPSASEETSSAPL